MTARGRMEDEMDEARNVIIGISNGIWLSLLLYLALALVAAQAWGCR